MLDFLDTISDRGATLGCGREDISIREILSTHELRPEPMLILVEFSNPLQEEGHIHKLGVDNPETSPVFGLSHRRLVHHMKIPLVSHPFPEEYASGLIDGLMGAIIKEVYAHGEGRKAGEAGIGQLKSHGGRQESTLPVIQHVSHSSRQGLPESLSERRLSLTGRPG
jgi:hypothetical protein